MDDLYFVDLQAGIRHLVAKAELSLAEVSRAIGRNARYLSIMLNEGTTPRLDLFVSIAKTCGYTVELHGHDEVLVLADRELIGQQADDYPSARVFMLSHMEDATIEADAVPSPPQQAEGRAGHKRIDWANIPEETEEQFARRDPVGYEEYRREMEQLANEVLELQEKLDGLRAQFIGEVEKSLGNE